MKLFKKSKSKASKRHEQNVTTGYPPLTRIDLNKKLGTANILPLDFEHSPDFTRYSDMNYVSSNATKTDSLASQYGFGGIDPLDWAQSRVNTMPVDEFTTDVLDAEIEAKSGAELRFLEEQHNNHLYSISKISDKENGEIELTNQMMLVVDGEIEGYKKELERLYELKNRYSKEDINE